MISVSLEAFWDLLHNFNWQYENSDDYKVWKAGDDEWSRISGIAAEAEQVGNLEYNRLLNAFVAHHRSGPEFGTPKVPLPQRPITQPHLFENRNRCI